jgi:hypothetical protein
MRDSLTPSLAIGSQETDSTFLVKHETQTQLLTEKAVEQEWGIPVRTLQYMRLTGTGPRFIKIGRAVRYTRQGLMDYLNARTFTSTTEVSSAKRGGAA